MEYLRRVLRQLLKEEAAQEDVMDAVKKRYKVSINYDSGGERIIEPAVYGLSSAGNMVLRAYQTDGYTKTHVPAWKEFIIDKIDSWNPSKENSFEEPPGYTKSGAGLSSVYITSEFNGDEDFYTSDYTSYHPSSSYETNSSSLKGNKSSLEDMYRASNFGDDQNDYTSGPVKKGNTETNVPEAPKKNQKTDYGNAAKNGPVFRGDEQFKKPTEEFQNSQEEENNENDEPDIDFDEEMAKDAQINKNNDDEEEF